MSVTKGKSWKRDEPEQDAAIGATGAGRANKKSRPPKQDNAITITVSSRTLFDMEEERKIYEEQGVEEYVKYNVGLEEKALKPGAAFPFVKALMMVNTSLRELYPEDEDLFDVVLMTSNNAQVGVRLINSINHYDIAAGTLFTPDKKIELSETQLRVAFDGDAVLFSDESEKITKHQGLDKFIEHEQANMDKPLPQGPLKCFLEVLGKVQKKFHSKNMRQTCPIRTFLVTSRGAASSGIRVIKTLRSWGLEIDEALFLAGAPKGPFLEKIRPHLFFDDQMFHIKGAMELGTNAAHVPSKK